MEQEAKETTTAVSVLDDYSVVVVDQERLQAFFADCKNLDEVYGHIEKMAKGLVADVSTKEGVSQIKSCARQIASAKTKIDNLGKQVVAELKELPKVIDANRRNFRERMEALQDEIRKPVTEIENRQAKIEEIRATHGKLVLSGSEEIKAAIEAIDKIELTGDKWKESLEDATAAVTAEKGALEVMLNAALKKEAEARAAAEKARLEREKAEAERKAAEAEQAAREALEREAEARKNQATANVDNGAQATAPVKRPSRWTDAQKKVNSAILARFAEIIRASLPKHIAGHSDQGYELAANEAAKEIIKAIACGKIENINVRY